MKTRSRVDGRVQVLRLTPDGQSAANEFADWDGILTSHLCSPSDAGDTTTIGMIWRYANKDGSPERRFANNY